MINLKSLLGNAAEPEDQIPPDCRGGEVMEVGCGAGARLSGKVFDWFWGRGEVWGQCWESRKVLSWFWSRGKDWFRSWSWRWRRRWLAKAKNKYCLISHQLSWQKSINKHIIIDHIYDEPVVQGKVLDLVQCQQWNAGGLGCLVGLLRRALSPVWWVWCHCHCEGGHNHQGAAAACFTWHLVTISTCLSVLVKALSSSLLTWKTSDFCGSTSSRSLRNWGAAVVGGRFLRTCIWRFSFLSWFDQKKKSNGRYPIFFCSFTFSLLNTALRPLFEDFAAGAGRRLGLDVDCLKKQEILCIFLYFLTGCQAL